MPDEPESLPLAASWLRTARRVAVFTGAGISAESGIPTFRDDEGFWRNFPVEDFATWRGLRRTALRKPRRLAEFLYAVVQPIAAAAPNAAHRAIAELEKYVEVTVVTQNVDRLHSDAGSTTVREVHGSLFEVVDRRGRFVRLLSRRQLLRVANALDRARRGVFTLPRVLWAMRPLAGLGARGLHFPRLILFGDAMAEPDWSNAQEDARRCDCMILVGTSGEVFPAALLPGEARSAGAKIIAVDPLVPSGDVWLAGPAATLMPRLVALAFGQPEG